MPELSTRLPGTYGEQPHRPPRLLLALRTKAPVGAIEPQPGAAVGDWVECPVSGVHIQVKAVLPDHRPLAACPR